MIYRFNDFRIDLARQELWQGDDIVSVEPMAFQLLVLLIENHDRLVTKDELLNVLWDGRVVSDAALSTCIKSARRAVADAGNRQEVIKTMHGKGLRWVADVRPASGTTARVEPRDTRTDTDREVGQKQAIRPSIAILPFAVIGAGSQATTLSVAIPHELIATISRLRWISVIARGSSFRFDPDAGNLDAVRTSLGVRYCLTGSVETVGQHVVVGVVLTDTADGEVIWADRFRSRLEDVHEVRETIISQVIFAVEVQIPMSEAAKARLRSPESIDAWSTYHLGLQSLYRFDVNENDRAIAMFERAISLEPGFARAHGALSFAHFKTAFMHYSNDRDLALKAARANAEQAIEFDPMDPFANFNMGRSLWLTGDLEGAKVWLNRATLLSPNFAQGLYARAWTETLSGSPDSGILLSDEARALSPLDPLLYAMLGTRAVGLCIHNRDKEAASWADRAATAPGAHVLISVIAAFINELAGNHEAAEAWTVRVRESRQNITQQQFFRSFPFSDPNVKARISAALTRRRIPEA